MTTFAIGNLSYVEVGDRFVTLCGLMVTIDPSEVVLTLNEARKLHEALGFAILHEARRIERDPNGPVVFDPVTGDILR